jgi:hypothetical protein
MLSAGTVVRLLYPRPEYGLPVGITGQVMRVIKKGQAYEVACWNFTRVPVLCTPIVPAWELEVLLHSLAP